MNVSSTDARLRVTVVVDSFPTLSETFIARHVQGLRQSGVQVQVLAAREGDAGLGRGSDVPLTLYAAPRSFARRLTAFVADLGKGGVARRARIAADPRVMGMRALRLGYWWEARAFANIAANTDVFFCHYGNNGRLAASLEAAGVLEARIVTMFHGYDMRAAMARGADTLRPLQGVGVLFLAISEWSRRRLVELGFPGDRIRIHRVGVDVAAIPFHERSGVRRAIRLLSVGRLVEEKGHDLGIAAVARLVADGGDLSYSIVGEGPKRPALERMIADAGLRDRVTLLGARRHGEVLELLADHDLFVLPSRDEVTPVSLMEAAASGLPAIATEVGAVREFLDWDDALVVDSDSVDALQAGLRGLIEREQEWPVLGRMGRARVERDHDNRQLDRELSDLLAGAASVPTGSA